MSEPELMRIRLRRATPGDSEFAYNTKRAAFQMYVEQVYGWDEAEQRRLHTQRFQAQDVQIISLPDADVGMLAVTVASDCLTVHQLFILPEHQRKGIGCWCMQHLLEEARGSGIPIHLRVMKVNQRALTFYQRLGFKCVGETDTHLLLEWIP